MNNLSYHFAYKRLSIRQRLSLLICTLLLSTIAIYGFANYYSLKKATLAIGKQRLVAITNQISSMLGTSADFLVKTANNTAAQPAVVKCLNSGGKEFRNETIAALDKLHRDSTWVSAELLDGNFTPLLYSSKTTYKINLNVKNVVDFTKADPGSSKVGKIYRLGDSMYYPIVSTVLQKKQIIGYIVCWQLLHASQQAVTSLSKLVGTEASFYLLNTDESLRTDMINPVANLPVGIGRVGSIFEYSGPAGTMIANTQNIPGTYWIIMVEFSENNVLNGINSFLNWIIIVGIVLTAIGIFSAGIVSGNITKPLNQLSVAATAIAEGNYSATVPVDIQRNDEIKHLADVFNIMRAQVEQMHNNLERTVLERTAQLENVNKELEAFSYSVSHDLRTPLRAIIGYSVMFKEDYESDLDDEAKRILRNIIINAKMMGQLIDDLLSFSRLGKKELSVSNVDMQQLTETVVADLLQHEAENKYKIKIGHLPSIDADRGMIKQVLVNLVGNAIKYSSKKAEPLIEIGAAENESTITYYIKDNGAGFDMAYAGKLFGVFQRLHSQEEFEGTGVGLALVKRIIDKHKGEVYAKGEENAGAVFYFSLPKTN